jgi:hypothetical protein
VPLAAARILPGMFFEQMKKNTMALSAHLQFKLKKRYEPSSVVSMKYKGNDISFKTDDEGNPVTLFIGKEIRDGVIKGERYTRVLRKNAQGETIRDHWDFKGKT